MVLIYAVVTVGFDIVVPINCNLDVVFNVAIAGIVADDVVVLLRVIDAPIAFFDVIVVTIVIDAVVDITIADYVVVVFIYAVVTIVFVIAVALIVI
jgi:hypothetical protein